MLQLGWHQYWCSSRHLLCANTCAHYSASLQASVCISAHLFSVARHIASVQRGTAGNTRVTCTRPYYTRTHTQTRQPWGSSYNAQRRILQQQYTTSACQKRRPTPATTRHHAFLETEKNNMREGTSAHNHCVAPNTENTNMPGCTPWLYPLHHVLSCSHHTQCDQRLSCIKPGQSAVNRIKLTSCCCTHGLQKGGQKRCAGLAGQRQP